MHLHALQDHLGVTGLQRRGIEQIQLRLTWSTVFTIKMVLVYNQEANPVSNV